MNHSIFCRGWKLDYDSHSGMPASVSLNGVPVLIQHSPMFQFTLNGISANNNHLQMEHILEPDHMGTSCVLLDQTQDGSEWCARICPAQSWELLCRYHFFEDHLTVSLTLTCLDVRPQRLRWLTWTLGHPFRSDCRPMAPGQLPLLDPPEYLPDKEERGQVIPLITPCGKLAPAEISSVCGIYDFSSRTAILSEVRDARFTSRLSTFDLQDRQSAVSVRNIYCPQLLTRGQSLEIGPLYLGVQNANTPAEALRTFTEFPPETGQPAADLYIMEAGIGRSQARANCPGHEQLAKRISAYAEAGFNTLLLDPVSPWPGWSTQDLMDIDFTYGTGVKNTIETARQNGMRILLNVPLRGVYEYDSHAVELKPSPYLNGSCDAWFMRHETGRFARSYNLRAFDAKKPDYIRHLEKVLSLYAQTLAPDGFFLDGQMYNSYPNWDASANYFPWESVMAGVSLGGILKDFLSQTFPGMLLLSDCGCSQADFVPDACLWDGLQWAKYGLAPLLPKRGYKRFHSFVSFKDIHFSMEKCHNFFFENSLSWQDFGRWQQEAILAAPCKNLLHYLDSGKTNEWTWFAGGYSNEERFGPKLHRVLTAICLMMPGGFLSFDNGKLCAPELISELIRLKNTSSLFQTGICSLTRLCCQDPKIAAIFWQNETEWCILAANLEDTPKYPSFTLDGVSFAPCGTVRLYDGSWQDGSALSLPPYGILLIQGNSQSRPESFSPG